MGLDLDGPQPAGQGRQADGAALGARRAPGAAPYPARSVVEHLAGQPRRRRRRPSTGKGSGWPSASSGRAPPASWSARRSRSASRVASARARCAPVGPRADDLDEADGGSGLRGAARGPGPRSRGRGGRSVGGPASSVAAAYRCACSAATVARRSVPHPGEVAGRCRGGALGRGERRAPVARRSGRARGSGGAAWPPACGCAGGPVPSAAAVVVGWARRARRPAPAGARAWCVSTVCWRRCRVARSFAERRRRARRRPRRARRCRGSAPRVRPRPARACGSARGAPRGVVLEPDAAPGGGQDATAPRAARDDGASGDRPAWSLRHARIIRTRATGSPAVSYSGGRRSPADDKLQRGRAR